MSGGKGRKLEKPGKLRYEAGAFGNRPDGTGILWSWIKQGNVTNEFPLSYVTNMTGRKKMTLKSDISGDVEIKTGGDLIVTTNFDAREVGDVQEYFETEFRKNFKLKTSTFKLFDALAIKLTESGGDQRLVKLPVKEYMELTGATSYKRTRATVNEDLEALYRISIEREKSYKKNRVIGYKDITNGVIVVEFTGPFAELLSSESSFYMRYPDVLFKADAQNDSFFIGRKIVEYVNENRFITVNKHSKVKPPVVILKDPFALSVKTLLKYAQFIPDYDSDKDRHLTNRIIEPLETALDSLQAFELFSWEWAHGQKDGKREPVTDEDFQSYERFSNLYVLIYPCKSWPYNKDKMESMQRRATSRWKNERKAEKKREELKAAQELQNQNIETA